jgi:hypothetical protein
MSYIQTLWAHRQVEKSQIWNGFVESANTLLGKKYYLFLLKIFKKNFKNYLKI